MTDFLERINSGELLLGDGAMGTELLKRGMERGHCSEEFNISHPHIVQNIYSDYFKAGSDIVETNSFGGNRARLKLHGKEDKVYEYCKRSAELAKEVCPKGAFVAGSIGPTGSILEPYGELSLTEAYEIFAEQAAALKDSGVDLFYIETMMAIEEAEIAVKAVKDKTSLPIVATMTFQLTGNSVNTSWGVNTTTAIERLSSAGADVVGANCGEGIDLMIAVIKEMREITNMPIIAQPNAGIPEIVNGQLIYKETFENMRSKYLELINLDINIIGGCCGTTPEIISKLRMLIDNME